MIGEIIRDFSEGQIPLKFKIVKPNYSDRKILIISQLVIISEVILFIFLLSLSNSNFAFYLVLCSYFIIIYLTNLIFKFTILSVKHLGWIVFHHELAQIYDVNLSNKKELYYNKIIRIRAKKGIRSSFSARETPELRKTVRVFIKLDNETVKLELLNRLYLEETTGVKYNRMIPNLVYVLNGIPTKTGKPNFEWL